MNEYKYVLKTKPTEVTRYYKYLICNMIIQCENLEGIDFSLDDQSNIAKHLNKISEEISVIIEETPYYNRNSNMDTNYIKPIIRDFKIREILG